MTLKERARFLGSFNGPKTVRAGDSRRPYPIEIKHHLTTRRTKIRIKIGGDSDENLFHGLIDGQVHQIDADVKQMDRHIEILNRALTMLEVYESIDEEAAVTVRQSIDRLIDFLDEHERILIETD